MEQDLFARHGRTVAAVARVVAARWHLCAQDRDDLSQELWLWLATHDATLAERLPTRNQPGAYLFKSLQRHALRWVRHNRLWLSSTCFDDAAIEAMPAPATADPIARAADLLLGNQALAVLSRTLAMLDAPARCLVYRYGALGEPASTVAGVLGVTTKALYGRWDRLRARLTRALVRVDVPEGALDAALQVLGERAMDGWMDGWMDNQGWRFAIEIEYAYHCS